MGIILWIIFGALAGWIASMIMGNDAKQGWLGNIVVGIVGAVVGGWLLSILLPGQVGVSGFNISSLLVAILGAVVVLFIYNWFTRSKTKAV
jgi:uncharacterized membrane protein YeaQ/YmgE (transglycosylase-associated protein family)